MIKINSFVVCRDVVHLKNGLNTFIDAPVTNIIPPDGSRYPFSGTYDFLASIYRDNPAERVPFTFNLALANSKFGATQFPPICSSFDIPYLFKELRAVMTVTFKEPGEYNFEYEVIVNGDVMDAGLYFIYAWRNHMEFSEGVQNDNSVN